MFSSSEWLSVELNVPLSHADVVLTDGLRRRMAVEQRSAELELGVEMRMTHAIKPEPEDQNPKNPSPNPFSPLPDTRTCFSCCNCQNPN
jgi:hypothetical protein